MINHAQIARVYVINTHSCPGLDRGLKDRIGLVQNVTRSVEDITTRIIRAILTNDERFDRLKPVAAPSLVISLRAVPVTVIGSVVVCCLCVELVCANASRAISVKIRVIIVAHSWQSGGNRCLESKRTN